VANGKLIADTIEHSTEGTVSTEYVVAGSVKAMAQYFGHTNVLQSGSLNHTSVTDNGTGDFTHNFTNSFANTIYHAVGSCQRPNNEISALIFYEPKDNTTRATSSMPMEAIYTNSANLNRTHFDMEINDFIAYGDLA